MKREEKTCGECGRWVYSSGPATAGFNNHDILCTKRGEPAVTESERVQVLNALFTRASKILGVSQDEAKTAFLTLITDKIYDIDLPAGFKSNDFYTAGDEDAPFFSEGFLYPLLGKEAARSILARLHQLGAALGVTRSEFP